MSSKLSDLLRKKCLQFGRDFKAGRIEAMTNAFYHPDAVMEGRDMPAEVGRLAISRIFEEARGVYSALIIELEDVTQIGDVAFANFTNRNTIIAGGIDVHRGLMIWTLVGDDWLVIRDFFFAEGAPLLDPVALFPVRAGATTHTRSPRK